MTNNEKQGNNVFLECRSIFVENNEVRVKAIELAQEIAVNAPLALISLREQLRSNLQVAVQEATDVEGREQFWLTRTQDHLEGLAAVADRRVGNFKGN